MLILLTEGRFHQGNSVVEQTEIRVRKHYLMLVGSLDALCIHDAPTRRSEVLHATLPRTMHVIGEREECIARARHTLQQLCVLFSFLDSKRCWDSLEKALPLGLLAAFELLPAHEEINSVRFLCPLHAGFEG